MNDVVVDHLPEAVADDDPEGDEKETPEQDDGRQEGQVRRSGRENSARLLRSWNGGGRVGHGSSLGASSTIASSGAHQTAIAASSAGTDD